MELFVRGLPAWVDDRRGLRRMVLILMFLRPIQNLLYTN